MLTETQKLELRIWNAERLGWTEIVFVPRTVDPESDGIWAGYPLDITELEPHDKPVKREIPPLNLDTLTEVEKAVCKEFDIGKTQVTLTCSPSRKYNKIKTKIVWWDTHGMIKIVNLTYEDELTARSEALWEVKQWTEKEGK